MMLGLSKQCSSCYLGCHFKGLIMLQQLREDQMLFLVVVFPSHSVCIASQTDLQKWFKHTQLLLLLL